MTCHFHRERGPGNQGQGYGGYHGYDKGQGKGSMHHHGDPRGFRADHRADHMSYGHRPPDDSRPDR